MNRRNVGGLLQTRSLIWLLLALVLVFNFAVRWRVRGLPLERDEGEYAYAGQLILQGIPPYQLAYNMKFPGVYFAYAALMKIFGETPPGIHAGLILVTSASAVLVFLIGCELMGAFGGLMAAAIFTLLSALPMATGLAGHATHFVTLFVCAGTFALLKAEGKTSLFWPAISGLAFGGAVLMKQHAVFFLLFAPVWLMWPAFREKNFISRQFGARGVAFFAAFAVPLLLTAVLLARAGVWHRFYFWTIQYAREYVSIFPLRAVPGQFVTGFKPVFDSGIWVWLFGVAGLGLVFLRTGRRRAAGMGAGLLVAGLAAACPGFYFRGHYFLPAMPGLALLNAALILAVADKLKQIQTVRLLPLLPAFLFFVVAGDLAIRNAGTWFALTPEEVSRKLYDLSPFAESPEIARYLAAHTAPDETITVLGSEPQIYFLAHRHSASGYIYTYALTEPQPLAPAMREEFFREIENARPRYVVFVNTFSSWCSAIIPGTARQTMGYFTDWWGRYSQNYELVGAVEISEDKPSEFFWDGQLLNRTNSSPPDISIFRRK